MTDAPMTIIVRWDADGDSQAVHGLDADPVSIEARYRRADLPVRVKPLVWNESKAPVAVTYVGVYLMSHDFDGWHWILTQQGHIVDMATNSDFELTTAKAAAKADYDARIRAALEE